jgi:hypothetical protein
LNWLPKEIILKQFETSNLAHFDHRIISGAVVELIRRDLKHLSSLPSAEQILTDMTKRRHKCGGQKKQGEQPCKHVAHK